MNGNIFLVMAFVFTATDVQMEEIPELVVHGEEKSIAEINKAFMTDDIIRPKNMGRSTIISETLLWNSPVPYVLDSSLDLNAKGVILKAFDQFRLKSCIDFKPRENEDYYITVQKQSGCWSYIGKSQKDGQVLSIGTGCDYIGIVEHEFLHALGFYHEQSRYDRDNYVTIHLENVLEGYQSNFAKVSEAVSSTHGTPYDYWSVMHYGKNDFTNGNGSTITTNDPAYLDIIGQRYDVSPIDITELNLLYKCNSTVAFLMQCSFSNATLCEMTQCSNGSQGWETVSQSAGGPSSDHTSLNATMNSVGPSYFMHVSTASGQEGDLAWLETKRMTPNRECHVQCLQFYYFHSGSVSDQLNIWIREFQDEHDVSGQRRLVGQITGQTTSHWQIQYVSLNATKSFLVEFEVRKGAGSSTGGISVDDINLSETECPHVTLQINNFDQLSGKSAVYYTKPQHSKEGYVYRFGTIVYVTGNEALFVQMLSGNYDNQLEWPVPRKQVALQFVDQNPNIQLQMSSRVIFTSGSSSWDNPRKTGNSFVDENNQVVYTGPIIGYVYTKNSVNYRDIFKGNTAVFAFSFHDLTPLVNGSTLPCPEPQSVVITDPPTDLHHGPCSSRISTTTLATTTSGTTTSTTPGSTSTTPTTTTSTTPGSTSTTPKSTSTTTTSTTTTSTTTTSTTPRSTSTTPKSTSTTPTTTTSTTTTSTTPGSTSTTPKSTSTTTTSTTTTSTTPRSTSTTPKSTSTTPETTFKTSEPTDKTTFDKSVFGFAPGLTSSVFISLFPALMLLVP